MKVGKNQVIWVTYKVIKPTQTTFMRRRHILEGVVLLHEIIHKLHRNKYDRVFV
jgi:hypothetical protein